jgi:hypothetical protein
MARKGNSECGTCKNRHDSEERFQNGRLLSHDGSDCSGFRFDSDWSVVVDGKEKHRFETVQFNKRG